MKKILLSILLGIGMLNAGNAQIQTLQKLSQLTFPTTIAGAWHYVDSVGNEYALLGNGDGLAIVDVTDPVNPNYLYTIPAANSLWREVKTYQHYAYSGTEGGGGITIVDLSGLPGMCNYKVYDGEGAIAGQLSSSHTVQVFDDHLYIFGSNIGTVICDLADPWNPQYVGSYSANYVHDGYVLNDTMWTSEIYIGQFGIVDVTTKSNPVVVGSEFTPGLFNHNVWFSDDRNYLYTTDELNSKPLGVFDVTDRSNIQLIATYFNDTMPDQEVHNVRVIDDYLINPSYGSQLTIVDGARPWNLIEIARYQTGPYLCWDASPYLPSGNIIASDMSGEFYVFAPYYVRACYLEGNVTDQVTSLPINGALVKIISTTKDANSNFAGNYYTGYPTAGTFDVEFSKPGYITKVENGVILSNGVLTTLNVQLMPFAPVVNVVDNSTGTGIPFAKVRLESQSTTVDAITDANGQVILTSVTGADYEITAGKWGYTSECIQINLGLNPVVTLVLDPGIYDDFTFDFGWTVSSDASTGIWVRDIPVGTFFSSTPANPGEDSQNDCSTLGYVTGNGGGSANNDDVDDGSTVLTSPLFDLSAYANPHIHYDRWFYQQFTSNPALNDTMFITLNNGSTTANIEVVTGPSLNNSTWVPVSRRVSDFLTPTSGMQLIVTISDKPGTGNPLEGGFDYFRVTDGPLGVPDPTLSSTFLTYPNPVKDLLHIVNGIQSGELVITDITGREMFRQAAGIQSKITVDMTRWSPGVYFVTVNSDNGVIPAVKVIR